MNRMEEALAKVMDAYAPAREGMMQTWGMERMIKALDELACEYRIAVLDAQQHAQRSIAQAQTKLDLKGD